MMVFWIVVMAVAVMALLWVFMRRRARGAS
jgi:uncharacterized protein (TIGR03382 family)